MKLVFCEGNKPWEHCEQKAASFFYLCIGTKGCRIYKSKHAHFQIEKEPLKEIWRVMEDLIMKAKNITYILFFSPKQWKGESVESLDGRLTEQAENCILWDEEYNSNCKIIFILNMQDHDTQRELLKETVLSIKALEGAIHIEMGSQNQQKINQNLNTNALIGQHG